MPPFIPPPQALPPQSSVPPQSPPWVTGTAAARYPARVWMFFVVGMIAALPIFVLFATDRFSLLARLLAWLGLGLSLSPALLMVTRPQSRMNSVAGMGIVVAVFYQLAVFHERTLKLRWGEARITDSSVEMAMLLAALAIPAMCLGWYLTGVTSIGRILPRPRLDVSPKTLQYTGIAITLWSILVNALWLRGVLPVDQPAVGMIAVASPTALGFAMVIVHVLCCKSTFRDRLVLYGLLFLAGSIGLISGMILMVVKAMLIYMLGWLFLRRRVRILSILLPLVIVVAMQPVKGKFRQMVWDQETEMSLFDRGKLYLDLMERHWLGDDVDEAADTGQSVEVAASRTAAALSLAHYIELTPSLVPHQWGATYRYFLYAPVPRVFNPDKPIAQYADVWAAVIYGYTSQAGTAHVMVGLGQIAECYINFGLLGALIMLMGIGVLYRCVDEVLGRPDIGLGGLAVYLYYVQSLVTNSEGSLAQFWGGAVQGFVFYSVCMALLGSRALRRTPTAVIGQAWG